jgi:hypothetical protein
MSISAPYPKDMEIVLKRYCRYRGADEGVDFEYQQHYGQKER